ncbi:hypothetical protein AZE42_12025 [Rhizopogon vesiculosus]|uniref:Uncharacterized protein n=1 Tax=Rhizopogon vesiculosus TaxID=180088 RepID=A0A1J8QLI8_9AGAM|nr:hypothetical protein AZE42_12025 [Rhizopogon vesiculosus]
MPSFVKTDDVLIVLAPLNSQEEDQPSTTKHTQRMCTL